MTIFHNFHFIFFPNIKNMFIFSVINFSLSYWTTNFSFLGNSLLKLFKITHILIRINTSCLTRSNRLLSNSWLKYSKSSLFNFLTKLSNEELRNWKLLKKLNLLIVKLIYFYNLFCITFILRLNLPNSSIIRLE